MAVAYEELAGSPQIVIRDGRFSARRRLKVAWEDTIALAAELLGSWQAIGDSIEFTVPASFPGVPLAVCRELSLEPFPYDAIATPAAGTLSGGTTNQPPFAVATAVYRIEDRRAARLDLPAVPEGTYLYQAIDLGVDSVRVPGRNWVWTESDNSTPSADEVPHDQSPTILTPTEQLRLVWERVPYGFIPWDTIRDLRGQLNDTPFLNHASGTVLFLGARGRHEFQISGDVLGRVEYQFSVREIRGTSGAWHGWNAAYRMDDAGDKWRVVVDKQTGQPPLSAGNFATLFQLAAI